MAFSLGPRATSAGCRLPPLAPIGFSPPAPGGGRAGADLVCDLGADGGTRKAASPLDRTAWQPRQQRPRSNRGAAGGRGDAGICRGTCARGGAATGKRRSIAEVGGIGPHEVFAEMAQGRPGGGAKDRRNPPGGGGG